MTRHAQAFASCEASTGGNTEWLMVASATFRTGSLFRVVLMDWCREGPILHTKWIYVIANRRSIDLFMVVSRAHLASGNTQTSRAQTCLQKLWEYTRYQQIFHPVSPAAFVHRRSSPPPSRSLVVAGMAPRSLSRTAQHCSRHLAQPCSQRRSAIMSLGSGSTVMLAKDSFARSTRNALD